MKKLISLIMALILVCSLLPTAVFADADSSTGSGTPAAASQEKKVNKGDKGQQPNTGKPGGEKPDGENPGGGRPGGGRPGGGKPGDKHHKDKHKKKAAPVPHDHEYNGYGSNPTYHWLQCACGCKINVEPHVDPLDTDDDYCFCGYHFSDNAQLVTLWLQDCKELKNFRKDVYEYETDAYTYKDVTELKRIATRTFDSEATVELPEDLTLKEGENKIEIKVTAENKKVSQIYTVIVNKEAKK